MRAWIHILVQRVVQRQRNIIVMDDNYTGNGSNNTNGLQIDRYFFWTQVVHTSVHIQNRVMLRNNTDKTPYKDQQNVKHFRVFGSKCYIKREDGRMGKFDSRREK